MLLLPLTFEDGLEYMHVFSSPDMQQNENMDLWDIKIISSSIPSKDL